jgi:bacteriocin leader peptide (microcyclamide/patellamide family)
MHKKNLIPQTTQPTNRLTIQELPTQFIELSDKDLQQIVGAGEPVSPGSGMRRDT